MQPHAVPRSSNVARAATAGALAATAAWIFARPLLFGAHAGEAVAFFLCVALLVLPAGWCLYRLVREDEDDALQALGASSALGFAALTLAYVALATLGIERFVVAWPFVGIAAAGWIVRRDRARGATRRAPAPLAAWAAVALAIVLLAAVERSPLVAANDWWRWIDTDVQFHVGNATALGIGLPLGDPRVAGRPFHYHPYAYAWPNAVRALGGISLADQMERLGASLAPTLVVLQTFNAARAIARSPLAGVIAAALVALHVDYGAHAGLVLGMRAYVASFGGVFHCGVYQSPSEALLLAYFATFAIVLARWIERGGRARLVVLLVLALASAGTKAAGMPVVAAALFAASALGRILRREWTGRMLAAAVVATLGALPMTATLAFAEPSFAAASLRWSPWQMLRASGSFVPVLRAFGASRADPPAWCAALFAPAWMVGWFGLAGVASIAWAWIARRSLGAVELFLLAAALAGSIVGFGWASPGFSQLFALYPGQLGLCVLAGAGLASARLSRVAKTLLVTLLGLPMLANAAVELATIVRADLASKDDEPAPVARYREGMEWIRANAPRDAVVLARAPAMLASVRAERAGLFETSAYTAESYDAGWSRRGGRWVWYPPARDPFEERAELVRRFYASPDAETLRAIRAAAGNRPLYVVLDRLRVETSDALGMHDVIEPLGVLRLPDAELALDPVFENEALRIHVAR